MCGFIQKDPEDIDAFVEDDDYTKYEEQKKQL